MKKDTKKDLLIEIEGPKKIITDQNVLIDMKNKFSNEDALFWKEQHDFLIGQVLFWNKQTKNSQEDAAYWRKKTFYWMEQAGVLTPEKISKEPGTLIQFKPNVINKKLAIMG